MKVIMNLAKLFISYKCLYMYIWTDSQQFEWKTEMNGWSLSNQTPERIWHKVILWCGGARTNRDSCTANTKILSTFPVFRPLGCQGREGEWLPIWYLIYFCLFLASFIHWFIHTLQWKYFPFYPNLHQNTLCSLWTAQLKIPNNDEKRMVFSI